MIVVATKLDATTDQTRLKELKKYCGKKGLEFHAISAPTGEGVKELVRAMADALEKIPKQEMDIEATEGTEAGEEPGDKGHDEGSASEG